MGLRIGITGGNHVLHRSLADACEKAGHRAVVAESGGTVDIMIVIDSSLVPRGDGDSSLPNQPGPYSFKTTRTILATSNERAKGTTPGEETVVLRTTPVYGITTDPITLFLIMMRSLPAVPVLTGTGPIQPVWQGDLAAALVAACTLPAAPRVIDIAGPEAVTADGLYERLAALTDRHPVRIPVPEFIARHASHVSELLGLPDSIQPILDAFATNAIAPADNALGRLLGAAPTSLDSGLRRLIHELDEVTPAQGVGSVQIKQFRADISGSTFTPEAILGMFRQRFGDIMPTPVGVEPAAPATRLDDRAVITIALPGRGHVEVRVREVTPDHVTVATLRGHAVAGVVRFSATAHGDAVRFEVTTCDAAANALDWLTLSLGGARIQDANWTSVVAKVIEMSGGHSAGVSTVIRTLDTSEAAEAERWIREVLGSH